MITKDEWCVISDWLIAQIEITHKDIIIARSLSKFNIGDHYYYKYRIYYDQTKLYYVVLYHFNSINIMKYLGQNRFKSSYRTKYLENPKVMDEMLDFIRFQDPPPTGLELES